MIEMNDIYTELFSRVILDGENVGDTKELRNVSFTLNNVEECLATCRDISLSYLIAELLWYLNASRSTAFISRFASLWGKITDDGFTNNSAYGYILHKKFGFDQIKTAVDLLKKELGSRKAVVNINTPNPRVVTTKDEPCTIALQFLVRNHALECTAIMRSSDLWYGIPYDVVYFTTLQTFVANELKIAVGPYHHYSVSLHLYNKDLEKSSKLNLNGPEIRYDASKLIAESGDLYNWVIENWPKEDDELKSELEKKAILSGFFY